MVMHLGLGAIWLTVTDTGACYKFYSSTDNSGFYCCQSRDKKFPNNPLCVAFKCHKK